MAYTILIVDGTSSQRDLLTHSLQNRLGYRTLACACATEAENALCADYSSSRPDLILLDWPTAGGRDAIASLKAIHPRTPLVVLVKYGDYDSGIAALNAGAQDFLTKPVATERVSTTFRNLLMFRDACRELERLRRNASQGTQMDKDMPSFSPLGLLAEDGNVRRMYDIEAEVIRFAMQHYHGHMTEVAKRLGIGRSTLYRKLSGLGMRHVEAAA